MRRQPESFATAVRAFKEMTAATDDAAATRARVLAAADRGPRAHGAPRRLAVTTAIALLVICSASVAGTILAQRWRRPPSVVLEEAAPLAASGSSAHTGRRPAVVIPPLVAALDDAPAPGPSDAEADAYGRAHRAHFDESAPERALAAWDDYLRRYPRGAFEPRRVSTGPSAWCACAALRRRNARSSRLPAAASAITAAPRRSSSSPGCATASPRRSGRR